MADVKRPDTTSDNRKKIKKVERSRIQGQPEVWEKYICPKCGKLLDDAVQSACGHRYCRTCVVEMFEE